MRKFQVIPIRDGLRVTIDTPEGETPFDVLTIAEAEDLGKQLCNNAVDARETKATTERRLDNEAAEIERTKKALKEMEDRHEKRRKKAGGQAE